MTQLDVRHLQMVKMIAITGNLTRAAKRLHISQPALSRTLLDLENRLGVDVFIRTPRKMILTDIGKELMETADYVLEVLERTETSIAHKAKGDMGDLRIGVHCVLCFSWLPKVLKRFQKRYPKVTLEINHSDRYVDDLVSRRCDVVITPFPVTSKRLRFEPLFTDDLVIIMASDHALKAHKMLKAIDFAHVDYLSFVDRSRDLFYRVYLQPSGLEPKTYMVVNQTEALIQMVKAGFGISVFPRWSVADSLKRKDIRCASFKDDKLRSTWYAASLENRALPEYFAGFLNFINEYFSKLDVPHLDTHFPVTKPNRP